MTLVLKIINKVFKLPFIRELDGYKTLIGLALVFFLQVDDFLVEAIAVFPDVAVLAQIKAVIIKVIAGITKVAEIAGWALVGVGVAHDKVKREE